MNMFFNLIIKRFKTEPVRTLFVVVAIASVISVVLILEGFREGIYQQIRHMVISRGADVIVSQAGIKNMIASRSVLPQLSRMDVEEISGVIDAHPITTLPVIYNKDNRRTPVFILVFDTLGGPEVIEKGRSIKESREIVIDKSLSTIYGLQPGDDFIVSDFNFKVAGISKDTAAFFAPFAFATYDDLIDLYFESDIVGDLSTLPLLSFLLVKIEAGYEAEFIASEIESRIPAADAWLPNMLAENDVEMSRSMLGAVFQLMIIIAYIISVLVISLIMFSSIQNRKYELAVFKAMGFSFFRLASAVVVEVLLITLLAMPVASIMASVFSVIIHEAAPVYLLLVTEPGPLLRTLVASLSFALFGALLSFKSIAALEPVMAFRS